MTARGRLTLLYAALVLGTGAAVLALTYVLVRQGLENQPRMLARYGPGDRPPTDPATAWEAIDRIRAETLAQLLTRSATALAVCAALSTGLGWLVAGQVLRPIRASIVDRDRALQSQRMFVANAAHELRTPLTTMRTAIDVTLDGTPDTEELLMMAADVRDAVVDSQRTLDGLLALARAASPRHDSVDLASVTAEILAVFPDGLTLTSDLRPAPLTGDAILLDRMVRNLVDNAVRYNVGGGRVDVTTGVAGGDPYVCVANTGAPVDPSTVDGLFEPFVRGPAPTSHGAGLGLSIVRAVVDAHRGTVTAEAPATGGLRVRARFGGA